MDVKYKIKGHETFNIREGWLNKGIVAVKENPRVFYQYSGADALGVGTNMAKSIRYWLRASGLTVTKKDGDYLTPFGELIYNKDCYMEDIFTLWILHCNIAANKELATSWYLFFNTGTLKEFKKESLRSEMERLLLEYTGKAELPKRSVYDDCNAILKMYVMAESENGDPEDKKKSPFEELGLLKPEGKVFKKTQPRLRNLSSYVFWYLLNEMFKEYGQVSVQSILEGDNSPGRILNLGRIGINHFLDILEEEDAVIVNRTAGLDMVYTKKAIDSLEILERYFASGGKNGKTDYNR